MLQDRRRTSKDDLQGGCSQPKSTQLALQTRKLGAKNPVGRPSSLRADIADEILRAIANGASVRSQLNQYNIDAHTFARWRAGNSEFRTRYEEALNLRTEMQFEQIIDLAETITPENANAVRIKAHLIQWAHSRLLGSRRPQAAVSSEEALTPPIIKINFGRPDKPPGWKITDDFPEYPSEMFETKSLPDHSAAPSCAKIGFIGEEPDS